MNIAYFVNECIELKTKYLPDDKIEFLIIGESPPVSGNYFYKPINLKRGSARIPAQVFRICLYVAAWLWGIIAGRVETGRLYNDSRKN